MKLYHHWDEQRLKEIARASGSKQAVKDVAYGRYIAHLEPQKLFCEWTECSYIIASMQKKCFRIIGMGTAQEAKGKGYATALLNRAIKIAKFKGYKRIETRSTDGVNFYAKRGFDIYGMRGGIISFL